MEIQTQCIQQCDVYRTTIQYYQFHVQLYDFHFSKKAHENFLITSEKN